MPDRSDSMTVALIAVLVAMWLGAITAVAARDPQAAAIGLAVALTAGALLLDPLPPPALLGALVVGGLLAAALVRTAAPRPESAGPGWPAEAVLGAAGAFAGLGLAVALAAALGPGGGPFGPPGSPLGAGDTAGGPSLFDIAAAGGLAAAGAGMLLAMALAPALSARPGPRHAASLVLLVQAVLLFRIAIAGPPVETEIVASAALLVAAGAVGALLARLAAAVQPTTRPPGAEPHDRVTATEQTRGRS